MMESQFIHAIHRRSYGEVEVFVNIARIISVYDGVDDEVVLLTDAARIEDARYIITKDSSSYQILRRFFPA